MTDLDDQGHSSQPIVSSSRPRSYDNDDENDDDVVNENDFYDALVGPAHSPSVTTNTVDNNNNEESMTFIQQYLGQIITTVLSLGIVLIVFVILPMYAVQAAKSSRWDHTLYYVCGVFVLIAVPISVHGIVQHLVNVSFDFILEDSCFFALETVVYFLTFNVLNTLRFKQDSTTCHKYKNMSYVYYSWYLYFRYNHGSHYSLIMLHSTYVRSGRYMRHSFCPHSYIIYLNY
jgi:hypothetical protein